MSVIFANKGVIDPRSIRTFGISAKDHANPIGYFGTGLKYAIAVLLRKGLEIKMLAGGHVFKFEKKQVLVRGKPFEMITMNGEELPFTTHLGANWELWQAFRELYCNALDERGTVNQVFENDASTHMTADHDSTYFIIEGKDFDQLYHDRGTIVLSLPPGLRLHEDNDDVEIFNKPSEHLYYRGIRVLKFETPSDFTYNITGECSLTEDRTLKHDGLVQRKIPLAISQLTNRPLIRRILTSSKDRYEGRLDFTDLIYRDTAVSDAFLKTLEETYESNTDFLNPTAIRYLQKRRAKAGHKHYETSELTAVEAQQLLKASKICRQVFPGFEKYPVRIVRTLGEETMALADRDNNEIILAKATFERGTKYLVSTMIEEYMHLHTGLDDCTRSLQTYLFDSITTLIENHVLREPI